jgi:hypothetical protein
MLEDAAGWVPLNPANRFGSPPNRNEILLEHVRTCQAMKQKMLEALEMSGGIST